VRKKLIIIVAAGLVSFAGAFALAWFTRPRPASYPAEPNQLIPVSGEPNMNMLWPEAGTMGTGGASSMVKQAMPEKQLQELIYEVREKVRQYDGKLQELQQREQRLQMAQEMLKKDIESLNNLRIELARMVVSLKDERNKLLASRIKVSQAEKVNLTTIAATYDKMDASSASKILANMCANQMKKGQGAGGGGSFEDAVKILHYMTERTKAKLLAELVTSEPELAAVLCQRLKTIVEEK